MSVEPDEYRRALRKFASGITVVTVVSDGRLHGMTATSFASVSLEPPLVLVNLNRSSRTHELVLGTGRFAVNVLASQQEGVARAFAQRGPKPFDELAHEPAPGGSPVLTEALVWLECRTTRVVSGGDHSIVIAEVDAAGTGSGDPLIYYDGRYRGLKD